MKRFLKNRLALFGLMVLGLMIVLAILAPLLSPYDPDAMVAKDLLSPSPEHFFGTDDIGRDIFSRLLFGARISLTVGLVAVGISITLGTFLGSISGYYGGGLDAFIMRFTDVMLSFPTIFLILSIQAMLTPSIYNVMVVIGVTSWMGVARLVRGEFLSLKTRPFVEAARAIGVKDTGIIFRHILPNAAAPLMVAATLGMAGAILTESALSFLGLGVQPPLASWGSMLQDAQAYMRDAPWMVTFPGLLILITVLSLYFVGEGLREVLSPKS